MVLANFHDTQLLSLDRVIDLLELGDQATVSEVGLVFAHQLANREYTRLAKL